MTSRLRQCSWHGFFLFWLVLLLSNSTAVRAQQALGTRTSGSVNLLKKGLMDIGIDSLWILAYSKIDDTATSRTSLQSGITVRRFIRDNLAVGGRVSGFYHSLTEEEDERGGMVMAVANYYMRLGSGMFFAPGVGTGALIGTRETGPGLPESSLVGFTLSASVPFAFYAWDTFNLRAGFELLATFGQATPDEGPSSQYTTVDGGFSVGAGYFF